MVGCPSCHQPSPFIRAWDRHQDEAGLPPSVAGLDAYIELSNENEALWKRPGAGVGGVTKKDMERSYNELRRAERENKDISFPSKSGGVWRGVWRSAWCLA